MTHCTALAPPPSHPLRTFTVLIVDDEPGILDFLTTALETEGYTVLTAANGAIALSTAREHRPDVILLDLFMPIMDGRTFAVAYHHGPGPHAPIIAMSASSKVLGLNTKLPEVFAHFDKPFELDELFEALETAISDHSSDNG